MVIVTAGVWYSSFVSRLNRSWVIVTVVFISSRLLYYAAGVRFDSIYLYQSWQFLDVNLLTERLAESILNFHSQPPLFNVFLGLVLRWFPEHVPGVLHLVYLAAGLLIALSMLALLKGLGLSASWSIGLTALYVMYPTTVGFENTLLYDYPVAALLVASSLALLRWLEKPSVARGFLFFALLAIILLIRSLFQLVWPLAAGLLMMMSRSIRCKTLVLAALIPLLAVLGWQGRNYIRFGVFTTSSWLGMNLSRNTVERLSAAEITKLIQEGHLSPLAQVPAFTNFDQYRGLVPEPQLTRIPALDQEFKRPPSYGVNYNYIGYVSVSRERLRDALYVISAMPGRFARNVLDALTIYFNPAGQYLLFTSHAWFLKYLYSAESPHGPTLGWEGWGVLGWYVVVMGYGAYMTFRCLSSDDRNKNACTVIAFMWLTVVYTTGVANLTEIWENNRVRFLVDPLAWVIVAALVHRIMISYRGAGDYSL